MVENSYVPVFPTDNYNKQQSVKKTKGLSLKDLGLKSDPKGGLTIDNSTAFISELGLSDAYAANLMSNGIEFKNFDEFQKFIDTAIESGNTTKSDDFYNDIFTEDARLEKDSRIQTSSAGRSDASQAAADKAFGIKPQPATPAPAPGQAQAARPTLDQPDTGKSAFARAAANAEPDFVNRANGNARWANPVKAQLEQEAKRRLQNELADLKKSEKSRKRAGEVDEILKAKNDQYRQLYANTPDAEGNARSAEDWDAMDRDQKIKLIQNYNINKSLEKPEDDKEKKSLEKPAGEITGQKMNAQVAPRGSMEDFTTPREFNNVTNEFEVPQEPRQFNSETNEFEFTQKPRQFNNVTNEFEVPQKPRQFNNQTNSFKIPQDYDKYFDNPAVPDAGNINKPQDYSQYFDNPAVPDAGNINKPQDYSQYFDNPAVPDAGNIYKPQEEGFLSKLKNFDLFDYVEDLQSQNNKPISPDELAKKRQAPPSMMDKLKNFDLFDYVEDLQSRNNKPISPDELAKKRQAPPSMMDKLEPFRSKMLKKFDDKMGPIYEGDPAALNKLSRAIPDVFDMDNYEQAPKVIRAKNNTPQAPAPQAPAPAQSPKLPSVDPFKEDGPAEIPEPRGTVKVRNSDGSFTYTTREEQKRRAEEYAKRQMRNSPRSLLGDTHSEDMRKLYPSLNMDKLTRDVDTTNYNQQRKQFDEKYASRMYPQTAANPTPRTDTMMRNINAMPQRQQLDVINSFRKHRGEDEIHNPFS
jgi:hypothetical protein